MLDYERKLKRGLSDISPLFAPQKQATASPQDAGPFLKILGICDISAPEASAPLVHSAAQIISKGGFPCAVISLGNGTCEGAAEQDDRDALPGVHRLDVDIEELPGIVRRSVEPSFTGAALRHVLLLAPDYSQTHHYPRYFDLLDELIVVAGPTEDSLRETYKLIKGTRSLNNRLHYGLLIRGARQDMTAVFEKFSSILFDRLKAEVSLMGYVEEEAANMLGDLSLNHLFLGTAPRVEAPAKLALADFVMRASRASRGIS